MRREERFMNILGGLDEKYVALAMPRSCGHGTVGDSGNVTEIKPVEKNIEISRKDLRLYWIPRILGAAAAIALIGTGVFLLWKNWDKIAISGNDRPGEATTVTTVSAPVITNDTSSPDTTEPENADRFGQITDTSMPLPFEYYDSRYNSIFHDLWVNKFTAISNKLLELSNNEIL